VFCRREPNVTASLIDVRPEVAFVAGHVPGSASIPLEELQSRTHELPPATAEVCVTDSDARRADDAAEFLRRRGRRVRIQAWVPANATESGPSTERLWKPNRFLAEALDHILSDGVSCGCALDVACGSGRDAVYLALRGYDVEAVDLLPDALDRAKDLARRCGVVVAVRAQDLEREPVLPTQRYDLVCVFRYLQRSLFPALRQAVRPGGHVIYETFHERNRMSGLKPHSPEHLLKAGELAQAFEGFDVLICRDGHEREGRFFSSILVRRPR